MDALSAKDLDAYICNDQRPLAQILGEPSGTTRPRSRGQNMARTGQFATAVMVLHLLHPRTVSPCVYGACHVFRAFPTSPSKPVVVPSEEAVNHGVESDSTKDTLQVM